MDRLILAALLWCVATVAQAACPSNPPQTNPPSPCYNALTVDLGAVFNNGPISGTGVTSLFASPPAIGGTAPAAGHFTSLSTTAGFTGNLTVPSGAAITFPNATDTVALLAAAQTLTNKTITGGAVNPQTLDSVLYCDQYASLAACATAAGANSKMILPPNTTFTLTSLLTISAANVTIECPSWGTVIKRDPTLTTTQMILLSGAGGVIRGCTIDGNNIAHNLSDLQISGANTLVDRVKAINPGAPLSGSNIQIAVTGANSRVTNSVVIGANSSVQTYGIWAVQHVTVNIDHNTVSLTGIDAIAFDGDGSIVSDNYVSNAHCYTTAGGGQIVQYPGYNGEVIANNAVSGGCSQDTSHTVSAYELNGNNLTFTGNSAINIPGGGIGIDFGTVGTPYFGFVFSGNTIRDVCLVSASSGCAAFNVQLDHAGAGPGSYVSHVTLVGNRFIDDQGSPTMKYGIWFPNGVGLDYLDVRDNEVFGAVTANLLDQSPGTNKTINGNLGVDNVIPAVASTAALPVPINPTFTITGTTGVTSLTGDLWSGRQMTAISTSGAVAFTAGGNIGNSFTSTQNVPFQIVCNSGATTCYLK